MTRALRRPVLGLVFVFASGLAACDDQAERIPDVLAQDSLLDVELMSANSDTAAAIAPDSLVAVSPETGATAAALPVASSPEMPSRLAGTSHRTSARRGSGPTAPRRSTRPIRQVRRDSQVSRSSSRLGQLASRSTQPRSANEPVPLRSYATIPAGSDLMLAADQKICTSNTAVGDKFTTRFTEDLVGPLGVVIPKGTMATGTVIDPVDPNRKTRRNLGVRIESVTLGERTYPVGSEVAYVQLDKKRTRSGSPRFDECVPSGARINARLSEPLKVTLSE